MVGWHLVLNHKLKVGGSRSRYHTQSKKRVKYNCALPLPHFRTLWGVWKCQTRISTREIQKLHPSLGVGSLRSHNGCCNENVTVKYQLLWLLRRPSTRFTLLKPGSAPLETSVHHHLYIPGQENNFFDQVTYSLLGFFQLMVDISELSFKLSPDFFQFLAVLAWLKKIRVKNVNSAIRCSC